MKTPNKIIYSLAALLAILLIPTMKANFFPSLNQANKTQTNSPTVAISAKTALQDQSALAVQNQQVDALSRSKFNAQTRRINQLQTEIARLNAKLWDLAHAETQDFDDESLASIEADTLAEQSYIEDKMALLNSTFNTETPDPNWSHQASEKITQLFEHEQLQGTELLTAACGATLCRIEAEAIDPNATEQFMTHFPFLIDWQGSAFGQILDNENGVETLVYFVSREDHPLPRVES